jgi:hypothetical protein
VGWQGAGRHAIASLRVVSDTVTAVTVVMSAERFAGGRQHQQSEGAAAAVGEAGA